MIQIFMFSGNAAGGIANANNTWWGTWRRSEADGRIGARYLDMAVGDLDADT